MQTGQLSTQRKRKEETVTTTLREKTSSPFPAAAKALGGPRGVLRLYVLYKLSKEPMCGYDLMSHLSSSTEGHWSPGSGSVYPVFKDLERKGYVRVISRGDRSKQLYALTERGKEALRSDQQVFNEISKKMGKIRNLMSELVSPENLADLTNEGMRTNRSRWETVLQSKELPKNEKVFKLKEYKLLVENELRWVNDTLRRLG